ncbi:MAG: response regulator [Syntrophobacteraceae bacterium]
MSARVLVIDGEESIRYTFQSFLRDEGHEVDAASNLQEALERLAESRFDVILAAVILRDGSGFDVLEEARRRRLKCLMILTSSIHHFELALLALRMGVFDYLEKPLRQEALLEAVERALAYQGRNERESESGVRSNIERILRTAEESIVIVDSSMVVVEINNAATKRFGLSRDLIGRKLQPPCDDCWTECFDFLRLTLGQRVEAGPEWLFCEPDSPEQKPGSVMTYPFLDPNGRFSGAVLTVRGADGVRGGGESHF